MPFCPICGRDHDPDIGCSDATGQVIREMGLPRSARRHGDSVSRNAGRHDKRAAVWQTGDDGATLAALGIAAYLIADVLHEVVGHGTACLMSGARITLLTSVYFRC